MNSVELFRKNSGTKYALISYFLLVFLFTIAVYIATEVEDSILVGIYVGVIPGIMLALSPTALFWTIAFGVGWLATRWFLAPWLSRTIGLVVGFAALSVPTLANWQAGTELLKSALVPIVEPNSKIALYGNVEVRGVSYSPDYGHRDNFAGFSCDSICRDILLHPNVKTLTLVENLQEPLLRGTPVNPNRSKRQTFKLENRRGCTALLEQRATSHDEKLARKAVDLVFIRSDKLETDQCVILVPTPQEPADFTIFQTELVLTYKGPDPSTWGVIHTPSGKAFNFQIEDKSNKLLLSQQSAWVDVLWRPLGYYVDVKTQKIQLGTQNIVSGSKVPDAADMIKKYTDIGT
jgi:hypothetical protein